MADRTRGSIEVAAPMAKVMAVIADLPAYPQWTSEVKKAEVLSIDPDSGRAARVRLSVDAGAVRDQQILDYSFDGDRAVHWTLVEGEMLRSLAGSYVLTPVPGAQEHTAVEYTLTVDSKIPLLGMMKKKMEKVIIDRALAGLKKRVEAYPDAGPGTADPGRAR
jgi:ribosome-associated toxin RatA of RatAB toxin-antitoxin module